MSAATSSLTAAFSAFAREGGYLLWENRIYGACRRYPFEAALAARGRGVVCFFFRVNGILSADRLKSLRETLGQGWTIGVVSSGTYSLTYKPAREQNEDPDFAGAVEHMAKALQADRIPAPDTCPLCQKTDCDALAKVQDFGFGPVHRACLRKAEKTLRPVRASGSRAHGLAGALLGTLVGLIPSIVTIVLLDRVFLLAYAIPPLCAFQGYKLLRGRMEPPAPLVTAVLFSLAATLLLGLGHCVYAAHALFRPLAHAVPAARALVRRLWPGRAAQGAALLALRLLAGLGAVQPLLGLCRPLHPELSGYHDRPERQGAGPGQGRLICYPPFDPAP